MKARLAKVDKMGHPPGYEHYRSHHARRFKSGPNIVSVMIIGPTDKQVFKRINGL
jgi:hypothetical protein